MAAYTGQATPGITPARAGISVKLVKDRTGKEGSPPRVRG